VLFLFLHCTAQVQGKRQGVLPSLAERVPLCACKRLSSLCPESACKVPQRARGIRKRSLSTCFPLRGKGGKVPFQPSASAREKRFLQVFLQGQSLNAMHSKGLQEKRPSAFSLLQAQCVQPSASKQESFCNNALKGPLAFFLKREGALGLFPQARLSSREGNPSMLSVRRERPSREGSSLCLEREKRGKVPQVRRERETQRKTFRLFPSVFLSALQVQEKCLLPERGRENSREKGLPSFLPSFLP